MVTPQEVTFPAGDGLQLHGQLFLPPKQAANGRAPAVIFFHGGSRRQMLLGLALHVLLPQRLRDESVSGEPGLRGACGQLPQRHRLRHGVSRSAQLRRDRRQRIQRCDGRRPLHAERADVDPARIGAVGRIVRRLSDGDGAGAGVGSVRGRRGFSRRPRLGHGVEHCR